MQSNNNTISLEEQTGIKQGSNEFGSMRDIHQQYNSLSGFESMLHMIKKYKYVLYPFIFLSVLGSSYSFYNDFIVAFPMNGNIINFSMALFLSVALEIVRDASILALFNSKMKIPSRTLVSLLFLVVTAYLFSSHMNAIKIIERNSISYTLSHQDDSEIISNSPEMKQALESVESLKEDLKLKRAEKTTKLIENSTSIHIKKREDALSRIKKIDDDVNLLKSEILESQNIITKSRKDNISNVEETQKIVSAVLFATLILIESLAMLGAVIKFIVTNNADKEIAKHSEIIEEYISISEVMKMTNISLTQSMATVAQQNADNNMRSIEMMAQMNQQINDKIYGYMNQFNKPSSSSEPKQPRKVGFLTDKSQIVARVFDGGNIPAGSKLIGKSSVINTKNRSEEKLYRDVMNELKESNLVTYTVGTGYTANSNYETALNSLS